MREPNTESNCSSGTRWATAPAAAGAVPFEAGAEEGGTAVRVAVISVVAPFECIALGLDKSEVEEGEQQL